MAEKRNELLTRNHNARPTGTQGAPEAHNIQKRTNVGGKGKGTRAKKSKRFVYKEKGKTRGKGKSPMKAPGDNRSCYKCGLKGH